jgi:hexosaminidase
MRIWLSVSLLLIAFTIPFQSSFSGKPETPSLSIVPRPASVKAMPGAFTLDAQTKVLLNGASGREAVDYFLRVVRTSTGFPLAARDSRGSTAPQGSILFRLSRTDTSLGVEGYRLRVAPEGITATAADPRGLFYAVQTLLQIFPPDVYDSVKVSAMASWTLPCADIQDRPRFQYRGMHLDVSRHFFPASFIKRYIDLIAMHKMNVFHWHLTDDNGWRLEIKKYPDLTAISAWRVDREGEAWTQRTPPREGEAPTYGGYYTQDEVRDVVAYAARRGVTIVPEIEMPGHSSEVFAAYPELSCQGIRLPVQPGSYWPNVDILCAGNDSTFTFIQNVLEEVCALFPGPYVHVGGDEADKTRWKACPRCQARIKAEGLKDEGELQSYFIKRIEKFLISKKKRLVGWDEILEGGLAPEATVMSWRGVEGGIAAAQQGHDVIMTPVSHCYFDYYQADPESEPSAIGGYTTLKKVYSFEPVPSELSPAEARFVLGAQGNVWTEFIATPANAEYMSVPRMSALSEVVWSPREARDWDDFRGRLEEHFKRLSSLGVSYAKGSYRVDMQTLFDAQEGVLRVALGSEQMRPDIRYTLDGSEVTPASLQYQGPFSIRDRSTVTAGIFSDGRLRERAIAREVIPHAATGAKLRYRTPYSDKYVSTERALVDGMQGSLSHADGYWQGYEAHDMDVILDLGAPRQIRSIRVNFLKNLPARIHLPRKLEVAVSEDGEIFQLLPDVEIEAKDERGPVSIWEHVVAGAEDGASRYVRVRARSFRIVPPDNPGAGEPAWMFVDEIVVE